MLTILTVLFMILVGCVVAGSIALIIGVFSVIWPVALAVIGAMVIDVYLIKSIFKKKKNNMFQ